MGVKGLWQILDSEGVLNSCEVDFSALKGQILAVDVSIWLYQFVKSVPAGKDAALSPLVIGGLFQRVCKLLHFGIKPIFVFDGSAPALKKETISSRQELRRKGDTDYAKLAKKILKSKLKLMALEQISTSSNETLKQTVISTKSENNAPPIDFLSLLESPEGSEIEDEEEGYVEDFNNFEIDTGSLEFKKLPYEIQEQILLESRKRTIDSSQLNEVSTEYNVTESSKKGDNALDFSKAQVEALIKRRKLMDELETLRGNSSKKTSNDSKSISHGKIASSSQKKYIFAKNEQAGWSLALTDLKENKDDTDEISSFAKPVKEEKIQPSISDVDDDDEFMKMMFGDSKGKSEATLPSPKKVQLNENLGSVPLPIKTTKTSVPIEISENEDESESEDFVFDIPKKKEIVNNFTEKFEIEKPNDQIAFEIDKNQAESPKLVSEDTIKLPEIILEGLIRTSSDEIVEQSEPSHEIIEHVIDFLSSEESEIDPEYKTFIEEVSNKTRTDKSSTDFKDLVDKLQNELKEFNTLSEASTLTSVSPTKILIDAFMEMLHHFRLPFLIAPFEAEAQCAAIAGVNGVISDDSDCLLFGAEAVYKGFFGGKSKKNSATVSRITMSKITEKTGLNKNDLIVLAHLLGCDYCTGIEGIGPKRALELVRQVKSDEPYESLQKIVDFSEDFESKYYNWLKGKIPSNFIDNRVAQAFLNPIVNPIDANDLKWGKIDQNNLERFMAIHAKWTKEKISRHIIDIEKMNKR